MKFATPPVLDTPLFFGGDGSEYTKGLVIISDTNIRILSSKKVQVRSVTVEVEDVDGVRMMLTCPAPSEDPERWYRFAVPLVILALALLAACGGDDFAAAAADVDAGELADAGAELVAVDRGAELVDVSSEGPGAERVDSDAGAELVDVAGELVDAPADVAGEHEAEAAAPPTMCKSIDGTGMCAPGGPWPYPCCRSSPCECCNKPNCGSVDP